MDVLNKARGMFANAPTFGQQLQSMVGNGSVPVTTPYPQQTQPLATNQLQYQQGPQQQQQAQQSQPNFPSGGFNTMPNSVGHFDFASMESLPLPTGSFGDAPTKANINSVIKVGKDEVQVKGSAAPAPMTTAPVDPSVEQHNAFSGFETGQHYYPMNGQENVQTQYDQNGFLFGNHQGMHETPPGRNTSYSAQYQQQLLQQQQQQYPNQNPYQAHYAGYDSQGNFNPATNTASTQQFTTPGMNSYGFNPQANSWSPHADSVNEPVNAHAAVSTSNGQQYKVGLMSDLEMQAKIKSETTSSSAHSKSKKKTTSPKIDIIVADDDDGDEDDDDDSITSDLENVLIVGSKKGNEDDDEDGSENTANDDDDDGFLIDLQKEIDEAEKEDAIVESTNEEDEDSFNSWMGSGESGSSGEERKSSDDTRDGHSRRRISINNSVQEKLFDKEEPVRGPTMTASSTTPQWKEPDFTFNQPNFDLWTPKASHSTDVEFRDSQYDRLQSEGHDNDDMSFSKKETPSFSHDTKSKKSNPSNDSSGKKLPNNSTTTKKRSIKEKILRFYKGHPLKDESKQPDPKVAKIRIAVTIVVLICIVFMTGGLLYYLFFKKKILSRQGKDKPTPSPPATVSDDEDESSKEKRLDSKASAAEGVEGRPLQTTTARPSEARFETTTPALSGPIVPSINFGEIARAQLGQSKPSSASQPETASTPSAQQGPTNAVMTSQPKSTFVDSLFENDSDVGIISSSRTNVDTDHPTVDKLLSFDDSICSASL